jgi:hypothetical protein
MDVNQWCQHDIMAAIITDLHISWKWIVLIELQLGYNESHPIYGELQLYNSCNLFVITHNI